MRRKPLFPPPQETILDPVTKRPVTKTFRNKGRQKTSVLTINGHVHLSRRWWSSVESGSVVPADVRLNRSGTKTTPGVREMAARLNNDAASFDRAANNLCRTAQVSMSGEQLRHLVSIRLYVFAHNKLRTALALRTGLKLIYAFTCARVLTSRWTCHSGRSADW